jgi:hypothetical protein
MCFSAFSQSNSHGALLVKIGHQQLPLSPSKLLICAERKPLVIAV